MIFIDFNIFASFTGPKKFNYKGHNYFYSGHIPELANKRVDWLEARNICRGKLMAILIEIKVLINLFRLRILHGCCFT